MATTNRMVGSEKIKMVKAYDHVISVQSAEKIASRYC